MSFLANMNPQSGQMGLTARPKQRAIDKILMRQRDEKEQEAQTMMGASEMGGTGGMAPQGPQVNAGNLFGQQRLLGR